MLLRKCQLLQVLEMSAIMLFGNDGNYNCSESADPVGLACRAPRLSTYSFPNFLTFLLLFFRTSCPQEGEVYLPLTPSWSQQEKVSGNQASSEAIFLFNTISAPFFYNMLATFGYKQLPDRSQKHPHIDTKIKRKLTWEITSNQEHILRKPRCRNLNKYVPVLARCIVKGVTESF